MRLTERFNNEDIMILAFLEVNIVKVHLSDNGSSILSTKVFRVTCTNSVMTPPTYKVEVRKQRPVATNMTTVPRLDNPRRLER